MGLYVENPVTIEAVQLCWGNWDKVCDFAGVGRLEEGKPQGCYVGDDGTPLPEGQTSNSIGLLIPTNGGVVLARQSDFVIKGADGKLSVCKSDIFYNTHIKVGG